MQEMDSALISVIVPVYNVEAYLRECLESIVNQTYTCKEILLIDDGSTDSSGFICEEYASLYSCIRVIHKNNGGISSARNRGIEEARGRWIIFLDADDLWDDIECLAKLHHYATSLNLDIVRFEYRAVNELLEHIDQRTYDKSVIENQPVSNYSLIKYGIAGEWFAVLYLIKTNILEDIRFNELTKFQEDIDFYCRLFARQELKCGYINEKFYLYRKRTESMTNTFRVANLKGSFDLCDVFYEESNKTNDNRIRSLYVFYSVMMYYWTLQTLSAEPYYSRRESIIKSLQLEKLHNKVYKRLKGTSIALKYRIFIMPVPKIGVRILHVKDKIRSLLS